MKVGWHLEQHGWLPAQVSRGTDRAEVKGAVRQPLLWDLSFKWPVVHLNVVVEASFRGPVLDPLPCRMGNQVTGQGCGVKARGRRGFQG